jgi:hypothetical protein
MATHIDPSVHLVERVVILAMREDGLPAPQVLAVAYGFKMPWVDAASVPAQVI